MQNLRYLLLILFILPSFYVETGLFAAEPPPTTLDAAKPAAPTPASELQRWNLKDVEIKTLVNEVAKITGKNFILSPQVQGKITFITNDPLTPDELYKAFLTTLQAHRFVAVDNGSVVKILPEQSARELSAPLVGEGQMQKRGQEIVTTVIRIRNVDAEQMDKTLKPLLSRNVAISVHTPTNSLIISSFASSVERIMKLVAQLDQPMDHVEIVKVKYAQVKPLVEALSPLMGASADKRNVGGGARGNMKLIAEERTNSILVKGGTSNQRMQLRSLVLKLDVPEHIKDNIMEVFYLKQQRAETIAPILSSIVQSYFNTLGKAQESTQKSTSSNQARALAISHGHHNPTFRTALQKTAAHGSSRDREGSRYDEHFGEATASRSGVESSYVQWDEATNSVIVTAPYLLIQKLKGVIAKLDIRRPQVLIQAVIAELVADRGRELGMEWNLGGDVKFDTRFSPVLPTSFIGPNATQAAAGVAGAFGQGLTLSILRSGDIRALIRALSKSTHSNILSTPNLVTLDNEPAEIRVAKKISFAIGQIENEPTGGNPFTSFERQDVGLILKIRPQITQRGMIKLAIEQEISNLTPTESQRPGNNPDTTNRYIHTTVTADNGQILVLGGLLQDDWQDVVSKIPLLGNLPVLGHLFRNHHRQLVKTNLVIFIRPTILYNANDGKKVSNKMYEFMRSQQMAAQEKPKGIRDRPIKQPMLPSLGTRS